MQRRRVSRVNTDHLSDQSLKPLITLTTNLALPSREDLLGETNKSKYKETTASNSETLSVVENYG